MHRFATLKVKHISRFFCVEKQIAVLKLLCRGGYIHVVFPIMGFGMLILGVDICRKSLKLCFVPYLHSRSYCNRSVRHLVKTLKVTQVNVLKVTQVNVLKKYPGLLSIYFPSLQRGG